LSAGKTWFAWDGALPVATITADGEDPPNWPRESRRDRAVYVCRLVVSRTHAGQGLGAALLDWAGLCARDRHGARWLRVQVWTANTALHAYYLRQGFAFWGFSEELDDYPQAALFQKPTDSIEPAADALFRVNPPAGC
jgi:GNAT superfamily N-acetyltransferase